MGQTPRLRPYYLTHLSRSRRRRKYLPIAALESSPRQQWGQPCLFWASNREWNCTMKTPIHRSVAVHADHAATARVLPERESWYNWVLPLSREFRILRPDKRGMGWSVIDEDQYEPSWISSLMT